MLLFPQTPGVLRLCFYRPMSAQNYSAMIDREIYLSKRPKKKKPLYQRQPYVIRCQAYKNGNRDITTQVAAPNVKQVWISASDTQTYYRVFGPATLSSSKLSAYFPGFTLERLPNIIVWFVVKTVAGVLHHQAGSEWSGQKNVSRRRSWDIRDSWDTEIWRDLRLQWRSV